MRHAVTYFRVLLSVVAALLLAIFGPPLFIAYQHGEKATGIDVFRVLSPLAAVLGVVFFAVFFAASRLRNESLRLLLFWTPATVISTLGLPLLALVVYMATRP
jgi:ABC-type multidrug transport system permease subunit